MPKRQLEKSNWMRRNIGSYKAKEIEGPKKTAEWIAPTEIFVLKVAKYFSLRNFLFFYFQLN